MFETNLLLEKTTICVTGILTRNLKISNLKKIFVLNIYLLSQLASVFSMACPYAKSVLPLSCVLCKMCEPYGYAEFLDRILGLGALKYLNICI